MFYRRLLTSCVRQTQRSQHARNKMTLTAYKNPPNPMADLTQREGLEAQKRTMDDLYCPLVPYEEYKEYIEMKYNVALYGSAVFFGITFYKLMSSDLPQKYKRQQKTKINKKLKIEPQYDAGHLPGDNGEGVIAQALENLGLK